MAGSGTEEHPCPQKFDKELTAAEIHDKEDVIHELHESGVGIWLEFTWFLRKGAKGWEQKESRR